MRRRLSSRTTIFYNFVLPILLIAGLSCVLLLCWLGKITGKDGEPLSVEGLCVFTLMWALVMVGLVRTLGFLKRVEVDDDALYISNEVKGKPGHFEIRGYEPMDMEEIFRLLESRARSVPIEFLET